MNGIMVSLFDFTGEMAAPWAKAGYECWIVDIRHQRGVDSHGVGACVGHDLSLPWLPPFNREDIVFVSAFPPCTDLAVSGARWFRGKGLRALSSAIGLFATAAEFCEWSGAPYMIENPVSSISTHWRRPDFTFHPHQYTMFSKADNYTKQTCLWTGGGFVMPDAAPDHSLGPPDDRIHKMPPSATRGDDRSKTPAGFARAVFEANSSAVQAGEDRS